jgi:hypothetical protein
MDIFAEVVDLVVLGRWTGLSERRFRRSPEPFECPSKLVSVEEKDICYGYRSVTFTSVIHDLLAEYMIK